MHWQARQQLDAREADALRALQRFFDSHGYAPSFSEMEALFDCPRSAIGELLDRLQIKGWITRQRGQARTTVILQRLAPYPTRPFPPPIPASELDQVADLEELGGEG